MASVPGDFLAHSPHSLGFDNSASQVTHMDILVSWQTHTVALTMERVWRKWYRPLRPFWMSWDIPGYQLLKMVCLTEDSLDFFWDQHSNFSYPKEFLLLMEHSIASTFQIIPPGYRKPSTQYSHLSLRDQYYTQVISNTNDHLHYVRNSCQRAR